MLKTVMTDLLKDHKEITVTTYREGDKADTGHRSALKLLGFEERELLTEFGYPTQKIALRRNNGQKTAGFQSAGGIQSEKESSIIETSSSK
ncbi:MAG: hypothetical protein LBU99_01000 [Spirochaetaceae bacterium]|jgi:hypothetical protein|nr:hypothetical protein [Spirochaetaceae bacterium]